jgi:Inner membrane component of T3SS, cytoplasmic domain
VGFLARWRRRNTGGREAAGDAPTVAIGERFAEDATRVISAEMLESSRVTEAVPGLGGAAPGSPHAPTRVEGAVPRARNRVVGVLVAVEGEFEGQSFSLFEGTNRLGREHVCEICLPSERVAPQHACIEYRSGFFRLEQLADPDLRLNFEPTSGALLRDGDYLQLGMTTLRFRSIVGS